MFYFIIVLFGLSLTEAYNIRLSGQMEFGKQLSKLFKEAYYELGGGADASSGKNVEKEIDAVQFEPNPEVASHKHKKNEPCSSQEQPTRTLSVMDEMVQNEQKNLHLYGNHKIEKKNGKGDGPLNNVHL